MRYTTDKYIIKEKSFHNVNKHALMIYVDCILRDNSTPEGSGVDIYEYNRANKITGLFKIPPGETKKFNFMVVDPSLNLEYPYSQYNLTFFGEKEADYYVNFRTSIYQPTGLINNPESESTEDVINTLF
jgi:hypothetical protein